MGLAGGMFNIIRQGQVSAGALARRPASNLGATGGGTNPQTWTLKRNESAIDAFWRLAPEQAARSKMMNPATMQRLQKLAESDNKDISAEKMRQAKAKLDGLRRQLQMLAATGDVRQLRRIAAEAASLAREIGAAARALSQGIGAQGIGSGQMPSDAGSAQAVASAANGAAQTAPDASAQAQDNTQSQDDAQAQGDAQTPSTTAETIKGGSAVPQSFKELKELSDDARNAIVQAKGIIALAAQMARAKRRGADDDDDRYFRDLQEQADAALAEVDRGQREATSALLGESGGAAAEGASSVTTVTLETSITTFVFTQTQIDVYA